MIIEIGMILLFGALCIILGYIAGHYDGKNITKEQIREEVRTGLGERR